METFKAYILIVGFIGVLGFGGYWAASSLNEPVRIADTEDIQVIAQTPINTVVDSGNNTNINTTPDEALPSNNNTNNTPTVPQNTANTTQTTNSTTSNNAGYADLISRLERLIDDNILMKEGSRGTRVGTVQQFLNVYNNTSGGIDNDYGPGTRAKVQAFQRAEGLTADGQAGPATYQKMIDWLNKQ